MNYKISKSLIKPEPIDMSSSNKNIYLRRNIKEKQKTDKIFSNTFTYYEYEEAKLTKQEYQEYLKLAEIDDIKRLRADIDYIGLMAGIDLYEV